MMQGWMRPGTFFGGDSRVALQPRGSGATLDDLLTGLQWRRCLDGQSFDGSRCSGTARLFSAAGTGKVSLVGACTTSADSYDNWRVPSIDELETLRSIDGGRGTLAHPEAGSWKTRLWSATRFTGGGQSLTDREAGIGPDGSSRMRPDGHESASGNVLCVRGGQPPQLLLRFRLLAGDASQLEDRWTGLVWKRCAFGQNWSEGRCSVPFGSEPEGLSLTQAKAAKKCTTPWRLPTLRELETLRWYCHMASARSAPGFDTAAFPQSGGWYWTSTRAADGAAFVVGKTAYKNELNRISSPNETAFVRCVRSPDSTP
jgi:hypothetical protein